jgi:CYTH domain-containing protein
MNVFSVPEAATILLTNGAALVKTDEVRFQSAITRLVLELEDRFLELARASGKPSVMICDRGAMDGAAFTSPSAWQAMLDENQWTTIDLRDRRYDAVIHMVTAAEGAEKYYTKSNNKARTETPEAARAADHRLRDVWLGHPHLRIIDNSTGFEEKIRRVVSSICRAVGVPEPLETERKFLIRKITDFPVRSEEVEIEQFFLLSDDGSKRRVRRRGQNGAYTYTHTIKRHIKAGENIELERPINGREYLSNLANVDPKRQRILKNRRCFLWKNQYFELDHFITPRKGLLLLEVELDESDAKVDLPPFLDIEREVTGEKEYANWNIAKLPKEYSSKTR